MMRWMLQLRLPSTGARGGVAKRSRISIVFPRFTARRPSSSSSQPPPRIFGLPDHPARPNEIDFYPQLPRPTLPPPVGDTRVYPSSLQYITYFVLYNYNSRFFFLKKKKKTTTTFCTFYSPTVIRQNVKSLLLRVQTPRCPL